MEASAIPATVGLAQTRTAIGAPLLRIRSDEQLVSMFRSGHEDAFRAIHDRYRPRLFAYTRQMLAGSTADAEDAVQEIFVRAYSGLRANRRELALRAWLYRVAHNRCIDELRRPQTVPTEQISPTAAGTGPDPVAQTEQRDALRRLIADVRRLPDQQRSALLMRELGGMTYAEVSGALGVSVPAVKSLLVRARISLAQASAARDTACARIREDLIESHDRGVRTSGLARRHMRDCSSCRQFRSEVRGVSRQLAGFAPALGPLGVVAKLLGLGGAGGGGAAASTGAVAGGGAVAATGAAASVGALSGAGHVVSLLAAAVVTAGGALELQHHLPHAVPRHHHRAPAAVAGRTSVSGGPTTSGATPASASTATAAPSAASAAASTSSTTPATQPAAAKAAPTGRSRAATPSAPSLVEKVDPDSYYLARVLGTASGSSSMSPASSTAGSATTAPTTTGTTTSPASASTGSATTSPTAESSTPSSGTTTPAGTASAPTGSGTPSTGQTSPSTGTITGASTTGATGSTTGSATVAPATSKASVSKATVSRRVVHRRGTATRDTHTVAVFTMTGN